MSAFAIALLLVAGVSLPASAGATDTDNDGLSDAFEVTNGLNPNAGDSDHDGLLDPAEDLDHDGLSNLAEQSYGLNPRKADTDADGTGDALEDADHDGVPNWKEQDDRPVPDQLTPPLDNPNNDTICYKPGVGSTGSCVGDSHGKRTLAIYGDSHAGQWVAALQMIALNRHWQLTSFAKSACPVPHVDVHAGQDAECRAYRAASEKQMRQDPPDLLILASYNHYDVNKKAWRKGLREALGALPASTRIVVLADTPDFTYVVGDIPTCLQAHPNDVGACEAPPSEVYRPGYDRVAESLVGTWNMISMNPWVCPYLLCSVVTGQYLMWRDQDHLSVAYAKRLAPALGAMLARKMP